ncbi:MAG: VTT domain-containing protein [Anaerolineae bacterium]|nr:VTT domain-containing protein [Anaerolineae bacterium]
MQPQEKSLQNRKAPTLLAARLIAILAIAAIVAMTLYAYRMREQILMLQRFGYLGIFLIEFIANASVMVPIPGSAVTMAVAPLFHPILLALVASTAASLGELFAYAAGRGGNTLIENSVWLERIESWMKKYGKVVITLMAAIPNPLFDTAGLAAGILRVPAPTFFFWCWLGKIINRLVIVLGASALLRWVMPLTPI